jgi:hypothetical protein
VGRTAKNAGTYNTTTANTMNTSVEQIAADHEPGHFAPVLEANAQMEETWRKATLQ